MDYGWNYPFKDFSGILSKIGSDVGGGINNYRVAQTLGSLPPDASAAERAAALERINPEMGLKYRMSTDRSDAIADAPSGYRWGTGGNQEFIPGGPGDPSVIKAQAEARGGSGGKTLPRIAVKDLAEQGSLIENTKLLQDSFEDGFAGWKADAAGRAANTVASNLGVGNTKAADWWRDYQYQANITRQKLFGSALTAQEKAQWDRANISPGMTDQAVRTNLENRRQAEIRAARKLAKAYLAGGYGKEALEAAIGFGLDDGAPAAPPAGATPGEADAPDDMPIGGTPTLDANPEFQADMASGRFTKAPGVATPTQVQKLQKALAEHPEEKDAIIREFNRKMNDKNAADFYINGSR
jgi:hypothetical protein